VIPLKGDIPTRNFPAVTVGIIAINVAVYLFQLFLEPEAYQVVLYNFAFIPVEYTHFVRAVEPAISRPYGLTIFTSMFMHGGFMHLAGNMLYLWIFGHNIEDYLGKIKYIIFYLVSGVAAVIFFTATAPNADVPLVGASGAIAGILGAYIVLYPHARIQALVFLGFFIQTVRVPAVILLGLWFVMQLFSGVVAGSGGGGVAFFAHVGGFAFGYLYFKLTKKRPVWGYYS
jgi:membrane associated rhomboid family serine protease